ncbi:hypothetical protein FHR95_002829 [Halomonas fontilapidosi]|uniref:Adhesin n=1 Tax=Halomonas fontilapidosi TaxID=616675 RepID=A0A7W5DN62_9GAMM|nr:hypothetical protein [Halomonas fontilapidosi]MBB3185248.1 hypothetical protein [Halomonas fontilapidosi]
MKTFHKTPLAIAVATLMVAPYALAQGDGNKFDTNSTIDSELDNSIDVDIDHATNSDSDFYTSVFTLSVADNYAGATVDSKQLIDGNSVTNDGSENDATMGGDSLSGSSGNIGANVAAGDSNSQANDAALASSDAAEVFGQAEAYSAQSASGNRVSNIGSSNSAQLGGNSLQGASGNIAANVAAGVGNAQQNSLAVTENSVSGDANATSAGVQSTYGNATTNSPVSRETGGTAEVDYDVTLDASGLVMQQQEPVVVPRHDADAHSEGETTEGHNDLAGLAFQGVEGSKLEMTVSGEVPTTGPTYTDHRNDASLDGSALSGASGNVGANVAAGTNNLQRNSLSIASSSAGDS